VTPIREVDHCQIGNGCRGPVTADVQQTFFDVIKGKHEKYTQWLAYL
jgi:branched-chain amino acid aminotransferase